MPEPKKILLVCFSFPPFPGIGGRRWAKFAKYLALNNYEVHVVAAENNSDVRSEWLSDTQSKNIKLNTITLGVSGVLSSVPKTVSQKVMYRVLGFVKPFIQKGNLHDKIVFIRKKLLNKVDAIIFQEKIATVIVSIPPYNLAHYLVPLKKKHPNVKFIVDYRDPWTDNKSYHGFSDISKERLEVEIKNEIEVLNTFDAVCDVNFGSLETLKQKVNDKTKFFHLPNGFDADDYKVNSSVSKNKEAIRFIYSGSFYPNLIHLLSPLIKALKELQKTNFELYKKLRFDFYGNMDHKAIELLKGSNCDAISFKGNVSKKQILEELNNSDFFLLFTAPDHSYAFNTKIYEYLFLKKPIIYFGHAGKVSEYILKNKVGMVFEPERLTENFTDFLNSKNLTDFDLNKNVNIEEFDIKQITNKLMEIINA